MTYRYLSYNELQPYDLVGYNLEVIHFIVDFVIVFESNFSVKNIQK